MNKKDRVKANKHYIKLIPCPDYDVEGMESWLSYMAANGLLLKKSGFFGDLAFFEKCEPCSIRYRLNTAPSNRGIFSDDEGDLDDEAIEIYKRYGWEYVASRGQFYIYRTGNPQARELNTDSQVQALAIEKVRRRERSAAISSLTVPITCLIISTKGRLLTTMITAGSVFMIFGIMLLLWSFTNSMVRALNMRRLRKRLMTYGNLEHNKPWKSRTRFYYISRVLLLVSAIIWMGMIFHMENDFDKGVGSTRVAFFNGKVPFATMEDFIPGGTHRLIDYGESSNYIRKKEDWLAPKIINWNEIASVTSQDGKKVSGLWRVDYYETAAPWIARQVAREYLLGDRLSGDFKELVYPELEADYAILYKNSFGAPTVIIQNNCIVVQALFINFSENRLPDESWVMALWESIK